jgi:SAM-dependent methyltransferase
MRVKPDWNTYLHGARRREMDIIFSRFPEKSFSRVLELGAGDGFQSRLLIRYAKHVTATELNPAHWSQDTPSGVEQRVCDAEDVSTAFAGQRFDLIYSSNLLEHLPDVGRSLRGMREILADDGLLIHVMPSPLWKLSSVLLYLPDQFLRALEKLAPSTERFGGPHSTVHGSAHGVNGTAKGDYVNNLKITRPPRSRLLRLLVPEPHGVSDTHLEEFAAFRRARWEQEFRQAGFDLLCVLKGPFYSGYGFGWDRVRGLAERCGLATEFVYVAAPRKAGHPRALFFPGP